MYRIAGRLVTVAARWEFSQGIFRDKLTYRCGECSHVTEKASFFQLPVDGAYLLASKCWGCDKTNIFRIKGTTFATLG